MDAFHAAYRRQQLVEPPDEYIDLVLIPRYLHIDPVTFHAYPPLLQERIRHLFMLNLRYGWSGNPEMIERG